MVHILYRVAKYAVLIESTPMRLWHHLKGVSRQLYADAWSRDGNGISSLASGD